MGWKGQAYTNWISSMFTESLKRAKFEKIEDAGHSPFVDKTALVYEKLRTFLI